MKAPKTHSTGTPCPYVFPVEDSPIPDCGIGDLKLVVGGFPRTATTYISSMIRDLMEPGYPVGHERIFQPDTGFCDMALDTIVDVTGFAGPYLPDLREVGTVTILHLMRHPVDTLNSCLNYFDHYFPQGEKAQYWDWMVQVWYHWQRKWADNAHGTVYMERRVDALQRIGELLSKEWTEEEIIRRSRSAFKGRSSKGYVKGWEDLPTEVRRFAESYGYTKIGLEI
jgi:hypothetical protein